MPEGGATGALDELLDFYRFASEIDRELARAFIATPYSGGPPAARPAFVITTEEEAAEGGVGHGKSTLALRPGPRPHRLHGLRQQVLGHRRHQDPPAVAGGHAVCLIALDNIKSMRLS